MRVHVLLTQEYRVAVPAAVLPTAELFNCIWYPTTLSEFCVDQWKHSFYLAMSDITYSVLLLTDRYHELTIR